MSSNSSTLRLRLLSLAFIGALLLTGCAPSTTGFNHPSSDNNCNELWLEVDQTLEQFDIYDAASARVAGYPFLRNNRFYAAAATKLTAPEQQRQIVRQLQRLDLEGRYRELNRLPRAQQQKLSQRWADSPSPTALKEKIAQCSATLVRHTVKQPNFYPQLRRSLSIEDDYSTWQRSLGLYPLTSWFVGSSAHQAHLEMQQRVQQYDPAMQTPNSVLYSPKVTAPLSHKAMAAMLKSTRDNEINTSLLSSADMQRLAYSWAPTLRQFVDGDNDSNLIGRVRRDHKGIHIDIQLPTVYYYISHCYLQGQPTIQINYVFWYASNRSKDIAWWARGNLDGFTLRYTLRRSGELAMVDLIKNCGCYHGFIPDAQLFDTQNLRRSERSAQILQHLPQQAEQQRLEFILSDSQQILHVSVAQDDVQAHHPYQLRPYNELEQLADDEGNISNLFNAHGIVPDTSRAEALFLYPMGIKAVGSMRQRGHQPITLIGRDHFDNPNLFDQTFNYLRPTTPNDGHRDSNLER